MQKPAITSIVTVVLILLSLSRSVRADDPTPENLYKQTLPSVITLKVERNSGGAVTGTGFMAMKDGMAITAYHVVRDAKTVTAKFSDGQEFEASGLVDKDEKKDIALVRVKVFGKPLLSLSPTIPDVGSRAYIIGAPEGLEFSITDGIISQVRNLEGGNVYQFSCPASPGNSGGPVIDSKGKVIGVVSFQMVDGQNLNFARPSTYALGLDASLPTQPWANIKPSQPSSALISQQGPPRTDDRLDALLAACLVTTTDFRTEAAYIDEHIIRRSGGFQDGVPANLYSLQKDADDEAHRLGRIIPIDPKREALRHGFYDELGDLSSYASHVAAAINNSMPFGWTPFSTDELSKASADLARSAASHPLDYLPLKGSVVYSSALPDTLSMGYIPNETLGAFVWTYYSLCFVLVPKNSTAAKLGLNTGDVIEEVGGDLVANIDDFYQKTRKHVGQKLNVSVNRGGKSKNFDMSVPQSL